MDESKQQELHLKLRFAEATHLLKALESLPDDQKKTVTHTDLYKQLTIIRDSWLRIENRRKTKLKESAVQKGQVLKRTKT